MLWTGTHFFKEIQYGQSICINFIFNFYKGLGSYFVFVLLFSLSFTHFSVLLINTSLPQRRPAFPWRIWGVLLERGHEDRRRPRGHLPTRRRRCWTLSGGLLLASPGALGRIRGEEPPGRGRPRFGQESSRKKL